MLKVLGYFLYFSKYPDLKIEKDVGLRYIPDLVSVNEERDFGFWGECGRSSLRKLNWILKHTNTGRLVLFKAGSRQRPFLEKFKQSVPRVYRAEGRVTLYAFKGNLAARVRNKTISSLPGEWFSRIEI